MWLERKQQCPEDNQPLRRGKQRCMLCALARVHMDLHVDMQTFMCGPVCTHYFIDLSMHESIYVIMPCRRHSRIWVILPYYVCVPSHNRRMPLHDSRSKKNPQPYRQVPTVLAARDFTSLTITYAGEREMPQAQGGVHVMRRSGRGECLHDIVRIDASVHYIWCVSLPRIDRYVYI